MFPYGAIASFYFANLNPVAQNPQYPEVVARLKAPGSTETFLDVGCMFGIMIRQLSFEGVSSERLYGTDLQSGFLDAGYGLFQDREKTKAKFLTGDILKEDDKRLAELVGKIDIIHAMAFFHLWEEEDQFKAAIRVASFLRPDNPEVMIFGRHEGPKGEGWEKYVLGPDAWQHLWDRVGEATGTRWTTTMDVRSTETWNNLTFTVQRKA